MARASKRAAGTFLYCPLLRLLSIVLSAYFTCYDRRPSSYRQADRLTLPLFILIPALQGRTSAHVQGSMNTYSTLRDLKRNLPVNILLSPALTAGYLTSRPFVPHAVRRL